MATAATTDQDFRRAQQAVLDHYGTQATSRRVRIDDPSLEVHLLEIGEGDPVVALHGGGGMAVQMEPLLGRLGQRFRVLAPDRPGCGLTDPFDYSGVDFRAHGVSFLRSLLDALEVDRATIVAGSIAGLWALAFTLDHPDRVERVALVGSPAGLTEAVPVPLRLSGLPVLGDLLFSTVMRPSPSNTRRQFEEFVVHTDQVPDQLIEATHAASTLPGAHHAFKTMVQQVMTLRGFNPDYLLTDDLPRIARPVLFVWGEEDDVYPPSLGQQAARVIPDAQLHIIEDAGHFVWLDAPDRTTEALIDFIEQPSREPSAT